MKINGKLMTEEELEKELEDYNKKCSILGIKPLRIGVTWGRAVVTGVDYEVEEITVPSFVTRIEGYAFNENNKIKKIYGENIQVIGIRAFSDCTNLEEVNFPNLKVIENEAFRNTKISSIDFKHVIDVGNLSFAGCKSLENVSLPQTVYIGEEAFENCERLEVANLPKLAVLRMYTFRNCGELTVINIPNIVKVHDYAILNCSKLVRGDFGEPVRWKGK